MCGSGTFVLYSDKKEKIDFFKAKIAYDSINYFNFCYGLCRRFHRLLL